MYSDFHQKTTFIMSGHGKSKSVNCGNCGGVSRVTDLESMTAVPCPECQSDVKSFRFKMESLLERLKWVLVLLFLGLQKKPTSSGVELARFLWYHPVPYIVMLFVLFLHIWLGVIEGWRDFWEDQRDCFKWT